VPLFMQGQTSYNHGIYHSCCWSDWSGNQIWLKVDGQCRWQGKRSCFTEIFSRHDRSDSSLTERCRMWCEMMWYCRKYGLRLHPWKCHTRYHILRMYWNISKRKYRVSYSYMLQFMDIVTRFCCTVNALKVTWHLNALAGQLNFPLRSW
jgi:hypothetical protein